MKDNRELSKVLFRMSDIYNKEEIDFDNVSGEKLFGKIVLNRIVNIAYKNLLKSGCKKMGEFEKPLKLLYEENIRKAKICLDNVEYTCEVFKNAEFPFAFLKGAYLISNLYEIGDRTSNDIDVLIHEKDVGACKKILTENGFKQGYVENGVFREASRSELIMSKMNFGETIPFYKCFENRFIAVDINFSVDYKPMKDDSIITKLLEKRVKIPIGNTVLTTLDIYDFIIYLCLHLFKEATTSDWVERRKDLNLYKFNDLYILFHEKANVEFYKVMSETISMYGVNHECYYALYNATQIFDSLNNDNMYMDFLNTIKPYDTRYLKEIINPIEKKVLRYDMDFIDWFSCDDRYAALVYEREYSK